MLKALVFDMDGVIIDSEPIHIDVVVQVLKDVGARPRHHEIYDFIGVRNNEMWAALIKRHGLTETVEELMERQKIYKLERFFKGPLEAIDGIPELMARAKAKGLKVALATSSPKYFAEQVLTRIGVIDYFDALVTADDISNSKPHPEIYQKAAQALGLLPEECLAIEDAYLGIQAAKGAGMQCVAFKNPNSGQQDTSAADFVVSSIRDIQI
jgi:HAD superfamily hydrolase (TIGR01509 family)